MTVKLRQKKTNDLVKDFNVPQPKCTIGRARECDLWLEKAEISRQHCVIFRENGKVVIRDLQSRNGTFLNGQRITGDCVLAPGDRLQIGSLVFEVLIDHGVGGGKEARVKRVRKAARRAMAVSSNATMVDESNISLWLEEADEEDREHRLSHPETLQFKFDRTSQMKAKEVVGPRLGEEPEEEKETKEIKDHKKPGKLPRPERIAANSSDEAAAAALRQYFRGR